MSDEFDLTFDATEVAQAERALRAHPEYRWLWDSGLQWYRVSDIVKATDFTADTIEGWCKQGQIRHAAYFGQQIGWRIPRSGLILFFAQHDQHDQHDQAQQTAEDSASNNVAEQAAPRLSRQLRYGTETICPHCGEPIFIATYDGGASELFAMPLPLDEDDDDGE